MLWPYCDVMITLLLYCRTSLCTGVIVVRLLFTYFQFWDGMQYSIPKVWQVVLSIIPVQSRIVYCYIHGLFDCSCYIVALPAYDLKIIHRCCVVYVDLVPKNRWWCFKMFFISLTKCSRWFPCVPLFTVNPVTPESVNHTGFLCDAILIFWWH